MSTKDVATHRIPLVAVERFRHHRQFLTYARLASGDERYALWLHGVDELLHRYFQLRHTEVEYRWRSAYDEGMSPMAAAAVGVSFK